MSASSATYVESYYRAKESIDLFENDTTSAFISKRSENKNLFRLESFPQDFNQFDGKKVYWSKKWADGTVIAEDGIPFVVVGDEDLECHYGPKCVVKKSSDNDQDIDHSYGNKKRRKLIQNTKKKGCPAAIKIKVVIKFPQYKVDENLTEWKRKQISKDLKTCLDSGTVEKEARYYLLFPEMNEHQYHLTGPFAGYSQPTSEKIRKKISELAMLGVRKVSDVKVFLDSYVSKEMFPGLSVPRNNKRYFPVDKDIRNQIYTTLRRSRYSAGDQQNLKCVVDAMKTQRPRDSFLIRTVNEQEDLEVDDCNDEVPNNTGFLFVHQTEWQKRLLSLYGQELCLLDATYNTSKYDLPLFFICVQTNVGFSICGTFITANESKDNIAEALSVLKEWNADWNPSNFLTDFDEREISAVEQTFRDCSVYLCLFHREQAWDRWLRETKNGLTNQKNEIIAMLRTIANSSTQEDYTSHLEDLHASHAWNNSIKLQSWLGKKWIPNHHRWVYAFRKQLVNVRLTTTNGLERKHQDLKRNYLQHYGDGTLSTLVSVLVNKFLQESYDNYITYNVKSLDLCRSYSESIPDFLRNRPKMLVEHCMSRLPPNATPIPMENIIPMEDQERNYRVISIDSDITYVVSLDNNGPTCQCMDWGKSHLPCKHMLAVFTSISNWTWDSLPPHFRDCPHFSIDPVVSDLSFAASSNHLTEVETGQDDALFVAEEITIQPVEEQGTSQETTNVGRFITVCSHLLKDVQNNIYRINNEDSFAAIITDLKALQAKTSQLISTDDNLPLNNATTRSSTTYKGREKLPLRKNRRNQNKSRCPSNRNNKSQSNLIIEGTFDMAANSGESATDSVESVTGNMESATGNMESATGNMESATGNAESATCCASNVHSTSGSGIKQQVQSKGIKRKGHVRAKPLSSKRQKNLNTKVQMANPVDQVQHFEASVNADDLSVNVIGYRINQQSFTDLESMLPDEIMNAYISLKCRECKDKQVHFLTSEVMTAIFCGFIDPFDPFPVHLFLSEVNIDEHDMIIGALNEGEVHWTLMIIFPLQHELLYVNPLGETKKVKDRYLQKWIHFLNERYNRGIGDPPNANWSVVSKRHRKQLDSNSCGVFVLKFAELLLNGEENLLFDSSKKGLQALRLEIGQYLVESSDNMQEVSVTQEITGSPIDNQEGNENATNSCSEDSDLEDEADNAKLSKETFTSNFTTLKESLCQIMNCEDRNCNLSCHRRHHEFVASPLNVYNRERVTHCFGLDVISQKTLEYVHMELYKNMLYFARDPKHPYTDCKQMLRGLRNNELIQRFKVFNLAYHYTHAVLLKELILMMYMESCSLTYEQANEICQRTEINVTEERRRVTKSKQ